MAHYGEQDSVQFEPLVETINADFYGGRDANRAFVHWAMKEILAGQEPTGDLLKEQTMISGPGDCGIDGWWYEEDQEPAVLHLFQGKFGNSELTESEIDELWRGPANLFEPLRQKNEYAIQLAMELRRWVQSGVTLNMHYVTNCPIGPTGESRHLRVGWQQTPDFKLHFKADEGSPKFAQITLPNEEGKSLSFLCSAQEIANIFAGPPKLWTLFKENPRGPLQRYNRKILTTLKDPNAKRRFHALNNGLSIVCDSYEIIEDGNSVHIEGMRIVNGCQTTVTLEKALHERDNNYRPCLDDSVLVLVRLTETRDNNFRRHIAEANNTQKAVRSVDLSSLQNELRHYHELFKGLRPNRYFLEVQAGDWDYMTSRDEKNHFQNRFIERESLAQAVLAFQGKPSEALEQRRYIFMRKTGPEGDPQGHFEEVFRRQVPAEQLLLPWLVMKRVASKIEHADREREEAEQANREINPFCNPDCLRYSGLYRTWLFGEVISRAANVNFSRDNIDILIVRNMCNKIDNYFDQVYAIVDETVYEAVDEIKRRMGEEFEGRRVFRSGHSPFDQQGSQQTFVPRDIFRERLTIVGNRPGPQLLQRAKDSIQSAIR